MNSCHGQAAGLGEYFLLKERKQNVNKELKNNIEQILRIVLLQIS